MPNLKDYDIVIAIDKSGSMSQKLPNGQTRWQAAQEATLALARKAEEFDQDGITVVPFAGSHKFYNNVTAEKVAQVFAENEPNGSTNTAGMLDAIFTNYKLNPVKPVIVVVVTDGEPDDRNAVKTVIKNFAETLVDNGAGDTEQAGIMFLQVGDDTYATNFLKELDDNLGAKFDIVDTKTVLEMEGMMLADVLMQALTD